MTATLAFSQAGAPVPANQFPSFMNRNIFIAAGVLALHVGALWALQNGLLQRAVELVVPVEILTRIVEIEPPKVAPPKPETPPPAKPLPPVPQKKAQLPPPPMPVAVRDPLPAPNAPVGVVEPQPPAPPINAPVAASTLPAPAAPPAPPAPRLVEISEGDTEYIRAPKPVYPSLSKRTGEVGVVIVAVYYSASGYPKKADILKSSGFDRLDRAARDAVMASQVTPFKRAGVNEETLFLLKAPINFVLE